jgi:hypothetical protein
MTKVCTKCGVEKPYDEYYDKSGRSGRPRGHCKKCHSKKTLENYHKNPAVKQRVRMKKYGLTLDTFAEMVERQGGLCAICKQPTKDWAIDHCHSSGQVRGLLCRHCNMGLGCFRDSIPSLAAAIRYLSGSVVVV